MMTLQEAIAKATKLLKLSESSNPHEAALAAQRAQEILTRYDIDKSALAAEKDDDEPEEEIEDFTHKSALDAGNVNRISRWKSQLGDCIAKQNQCRVYTCGNKLGIIGRASDVEKVRYLYEMLVRETDSLTDRHGKGCGRSWRDQFRLGVIDAIREKLAVTRDKVISEMRAENNGMALVRVNQAIEKIENKNRSLNAWISQNLNLKRGRSSYSRHAPGAREAGFQAGQSITLSNARAALGAGTKQIKK